MPFREFIAKDIKFILKVTLYSLLLFEHATWVLIRCLIILILECLFFPIGDNRFSHCLSGKIYPTLSTLTRSIDNLMNSYYGWVDRFADKISYSLLNNSSKKTYIIIIVIIILVI